MNSEIWASIISAGVVLLTLGYNIWKNHNGFKIARDNDKYKLDYDLVKERRDIAKNKLEEFYYPLRNYLAKSKSAYKILVKNKPESFRTLEFLLHPMKKFDGKNVELSDNDHVLLKRIFDIGKEIENLITEKGFLVTDPKFTDPYVPSDGFEGEYPEEMSLLTFASSHFSFIRDAYHGNLTKDDRFFIYVYPRELNRRVIKKIEELENDIENEESTMTYIRYNKLK